MDEEQERSAYAGRWVARVQGRVIAQGGTPYEARSAAQRARHKEEAEITYMPAEGAFVLSPLVQRVRELIPDQEIYLVGGAVRDALLGKLSYDLDFAVPASAIAIARKVANALRADFYVMDEAFDVARVIVPSGEELAAGASREILDFTSFRAQPEGETHPPTLESDLRGRDFTINAMAYDLRAGAILDPLHGGEDLRAKLLRACSTSALDDDAIRILRAVRLAAALDLRIEHGTRQAMKAAASRLTGISPERLRDELFKTLAGKRPEAALRALQMLGTFEYFMPELVELQGVEQSAPHVSDVWEHTLRTVQHLDDIVGSLAGQPDGKKNQDLFTGLLSGRLGRHRERFEAHLGNSLNSERTMESLLLFAALYHDVAKPEMKTIDETGRTRFLGHEKSGAEVGARRARAFNLSTAEVERVEKIIGNHMRFHFHVSRLEGEGKGPSRRAIYRFFREAGEAGVDLILLGLADLRGVRGHLLTQETWSRGLDVARILLENYWERPEETVAPPRLVDGNEVMQEYGLPPGPMIGQLLEAIREGQATGKIATRDEAIEFGREWVKAKMKDESGKRSSKV